uniref:Uncharacterized protein n=1 Tax=Geoglobus ahangari TaxID=113653 RepID=A0A7C3YGD6_9EURY
MVSGRLSDGDREHFLQLVAKFALMNAKTLEEMYRDVLEEFESLIQESYELEERVAKDELKLYFSAVLQPLVTEAYIDFLTGNCRPSS